MAKDIRAEALSRKLPKAVHYQCVWLVRDRERLEAVLEAKRKGDPSGALMTPYEGETAFRLKCIYDALELVPEEYRTGLLAGFDGRMDGTDYAHENTWKKWKRIFLFGLAVNLRLIEGEEAEKQR